LFSGSSVLAISNRLTNLEAFQTRPADVQLLGELLLFCYAFDQAKVLDSCNVVTFPSLFNMILIGVVYMSANCSYYWQMLKPDLQNDFSFYRRSLGSKALANSPHPITPDAANVVSMWLAQNLPMTSSIRRETNAFAVGNLANLCCGMIVRGTCQDPIVTTKVLRIMVAATVAYDRIARDGVFCSQSIVKVGSA
jgi:hypothetical protein